MLISTTALIILLSNTIKHIHASFSFSFYLDFANTDVRHVMQMSDIDCRYEVLLGNYCYNLIVNINMLKDHSKYSPT